MSWKLLIGVLLILIVVSSGLVGNLGGLKDKLLSIFQELGLENSPLSGIFQVGKEPKQLDLVITANVLDIKSDVPIALESPGFNAAEFIGNIKLDFENGKAVYTEDNSKFNFNTKLEGEIKNLKFKKLVLENLGLKVLSDSWGISSQNGTVEIYDFSGKGVIKSDSFELIGNATEVVRK